MVSLSLWEFQAKDTELRISATAHLQTLSNDFFFCPLQNLESSLRYRYWLSYLTWTALLQAQFHFSFWKIQFNNVWIFLWWLHIPLMFSENSLKSLEQSFNIIRIDYSCILLIILFNVLEQNIHTKGQ